MTGDSSLFLPGGAQLSAAENGANVWTRIVSATSLESSVDGGITWQAVPPTPGTTFVGLASIAFGDGKWVMAGENKQYYSLDGQQWTEATAHAPVVPVRHHALSYIGTEWLVVGGQSGVSNCAYSVDAIT